jgi:hypothetical protein
MIVHVPSRFQERRRKAANYRRLPIEQKEFHRWLQRASRAKAALAEAAMISIIDDRESDIYEKWTRLPSIFQYFGSRLAFTPGYHLWRGCTNAWNSVSSPACRGFHVAAQPHSVSSSAPSPARRRGRGALVAERGLAAAEQ